jgi:putative FmdB family regulatory protein
MPLYEYQCESCKATRELLVARYQYSDTVPCPVCDSGVMRRLPSVSHVHSGGAGRSNSYSSGHLSEHSAPGSIGISIEDSVGLTMKDVSVSGFDTAVSVQRSDDVDIDGLQTWDVNTALDPTDSTDVRLCNTTMHEPDEK